MVKKPIDDFYSNTPKEDKPTKAPAPNLVQVHAIPEAVVEVEMTEQVVESLTVELESRGFEEGVAFLVDVNGRFLCTSDVPKKELINRGFVIGDLA